MRVDLKVDIPGDDNHKKRQPARRPVTQKVFLAWVDKLPVSDGTKERFRLLVRNVPSTVYRAIMERSHDYIRRFELEQHRELMGYEAAEESMLGTEKQKTLLPPVESEPKRRVIASWDDDITLPSNKEENSGNKDSKEDKWPDPWSSSWGNHQEEKWPELSNPCDNVNQVGPVTSSTERPGNHLHSTVPDRGIGLLRSGGELSPGCERTEAGSPSTENDSNDRLRVLNSTSSGIQSVRLGEERPCEGGDGNSECTGTDRPGLQGESSGLVDECEQKLDDR